MSDYRVIVTEQVTTTTNIPDATAQAGSVVATNISDPSAPASGALKTYSSTADNRFHDKNSAGVVGTTVVSSTATSNNFLTGINPDGTITEAQPAFSNLTGRW